MALRSKLIPVALGLLALAPLGAQALTCYQVIGKDDAVVYRSPDPPFALSGAEYTKGRQRLNAQGQSLMWFEATKCPEFLPTTRAPGTEAVAGEANKLINAPDYVSGTGGGAGGVPGKR